MSPLTLVELRPDRAAFACWAAAKGLPSRLPGRSSLLDPGYAWHALLKAGLGAQAPKPFVDRAVLRSNRLLGYVAAPAASIEPLVASGSEEALALGLSALRASELPGHWSPGVSLSFEVRLRPVLRTRTTARSGAVDEVDVALRAAQREPAIEREAAYIEWLRAELARDRAAELVSASLMAFRRLDVLRRTQGPTRNWAAVEGPEAWFNGRLSVVDGDAFGRLLRRGLGRHRAFGFGCLLVGRPGVFD